MPQRGSRRFAEDICLEALVGGRRRGRLLRMRPRGALLGARSADRALAARRCLRSAAHNGRRSSAVRQVPPSRRACAGGAWPAASARRLPVGAPGDATRREAAAWRVARRSSASASAPPHAPAGAIGSILAAPPPRDAPSPRRRLAERWRGAPAAQPSAQLIRHTETQRQPRRADRGQAKMSTGATGGCEGEHAAPSRAHAVGEQRSDDRRARGSAPSRWMRSAALAARRGRSSPACSSRSERPRARHCLGATCSSDPLGQQRSSEKPR